MLAGLLTSSKVSVPISGQSLIPDTNVISPKLSISFA